MLFQYLLTIATANRKQTFKETLERGGFKLVFVEIYRIIMKGITVFFDFFLAFFGIVAFIRGEMLSYFLLIIGAVLMYIFVLKDYSEEEIIRYFAKKYGYSVEILEKIILIFYPCVIALQTAIRILAVIVK